MIRRSLPHIMRKALFLAAILLLSATTARSQTGCMDKFMQLCSDAEELILNDFRDSTGISFSITAEDSMLPYHYMLFVKLKNGAIMPLSGFNVSKEYRSQFEAQKLSGKQKRIFHKLCSHTDIPYHTIDCIYSSIAAGDGDGMTAFAEYKVSANPSGIRFKHRVVEKVYDTDEVIDRLQAITGPR